jgi:hypothetical protein
VRDQEATNSERAEAARRVLIDSLIASGIIPTPPGETLWRSVGVMATEPDFRDHYIEVILPAAVDVSQIPSEIDGVRIVVVHEDRDSVAFAPMEGWPGVERMNQQD